ncbi:MAG: response regulator, partial [Bacteroidota bacterium]
MESDYNFGDKTILVAENDDTNFIFYREAFRKTGADVIWAKNGSQAVEIIRTNPKVDLVLMDIQMPIM